MCNYFTDGADDRDMFAQLLAKAFRVVLEPTMRSSLSSRTCQEQSDILEQFFKIFVRNVAPLNPETFQSEHIVRRLVVQKVQ